MTIIVHNVVLVDCGTRANSQTLKMQIGKPSVVLIPRDMEWTNLEKFLDKKRNGTVQWCMGHFLLEGR